MKNKKNTEILGLSSHYIFSCEIKPIQTILFVTKLLAFLSASHCVKFVLFCNNSSTFKAPASLDNLLCVERTLQLNKHETEDTNNINQGW